MTLEIPELNIKISPDKHLVVAYAFYRDYNTIIRNFFSSLFSIYKSQQERNIEPKFDLILSAMLDKICELSGDYLKMYEVEDHDKNFLLATLKRKSLFNKIICQNSLRKNISLIRKLLIQFYHSIIKKTRSSSGYKFDEIYLKRSINKASADFTRLTKQKITPAEYIQQISGILTRCPYAGYYTDLIIAVDDFSYNQKFIEFCSAINEELASSVIDVYNGLFYYKNKNTLVDLITDGKRNDFLKKTAEFPLFDEDSFVTLFIKDLKSNQNNYSSQTLNLLIQNLKNKFGIHPDSMHELIIYRNNKIFFEQLATEEGKQQLSSIIIKRKLLRSAKLFEQRDGFFSSIVYSHFITSLGVSGVIFMILSCIVLSLLSPLFGLNLSLHFIRTFLITSLVIGSFFGFIEWIKYMAEKNDWMELTDGGLKSVASIENEINEFYRKYSSMINNL